MPAPDTSHLYQLQEIANTVDALTAHFNVFRYEKDSTPSYVLRNNVKLPVLYFGAIPVINNTHRESLSSLFTIRTHSNNSEVVLSFKYPVYNETDNNYKLTQSSLDINDRIFFSYSAITKLSSVPIDYQSIVNYNNIPNSQRFDYLKDKNNLARLSAFANQVPLPDGTMILEPINMDNRIRKRVTLYNNTEEDKNIIRFHLYNKINEINSLQDIEYGNKNLLYYTIFDCGSGFKHIIDYNLNTIHETTSAKNFDVLFITDEPTKTILESLSVTQFFNTKYHVISEKITDGVLASIQKLKIYDFQEIDNYNKILFIDADTVAIKNINSTFTLDVSSNSFEVSKYTFAVSNPFNMIHSLKSFSLDELNYAVRNNVKPFNAGQFMFKNTLKMRKHFENVNWLYDIWPGSYFYEQSFLNYYFNIAAKNKTNNVLDKHIALFNFKTPLSSFYNSDISLVHLAIGSLPELKLFNMNKFVSDYKNYAVQQTT